MQTQYENIGTKIANNLRNYKFHNWFGLVGLVIYAITFFFTIESFVRFTNTEAQGWKIFFGIFDRFTFQSNWLLFIYMFLYVFKPNHQIFKNNRFLICTMVYIFFTFIGYNVVLVGISKDRAYVGDPMAIASNAWVHIVAPLFFVIYGYIFMYSNPNQGPDKFGKTLGFGMIYPMLYATYLITVPFVFTDYRINPENYGLKLGDAGYGLAYSVYGKSTNTYNFSTSYAYIFVMLLGFFPGSFALFNYSWKWFDKLNANKFGK